MPISRTTRNATARTMPVLSKSCAFSGHRPRKFPWKYDEMDGRCVALKAVLTEQIRLLADAGVTQFLSGMAEATDYEKGKVMRSEISDAVRDSSR